MENSARSGVEGAPSVELGSVEVRARVGRWRIRRARIAAGGVRTAGVARRAGVDPRSSVGLLADRAAHAIGGASQTERAVGVEHTLRTAVAAREGARREQD